MAANRHPVSTSAGDASHVAILLGTYQGEAYLGEQLDSIDAQTHRNWRLWASDDGSHDDTLSILESYREQWGPSRLCCRGGPGRGFVANFLTLVCDTQIQADYYAYADQDDIWLPDKLERALESLAPIPRNQPALYSSRSQLIDAEGNRLGLSPENRRPPAFANALVQNIASGNTMVLNHAARELLRQAGPDVDTPLHDWWTYALVTGSGGTMIYDPRPGLLYRQHASNLIGMRSDWRTYPKRLSVLLKGDYQQRLQRNLNELWRVQELLSPENRQRLQCFVAARQGHLLARLTGVRRAGVYRQTQLGNMSMLLATILNKT